MLKILQYVFSIITIAFAAYGLITKNFEYQHFMMLFLGLTMLILGLQEFKKGKKGSGWMMVGVFVLAMLVTIQGFILG